ncbi:hypothetical protein Q5741_01575 [Paenibacillus sp. JX-17]|uniref:Uncharacterized protein n=1 Tax=Paenibacillus lacisoli TaxID=3064525 RepID=A0ABT9C789_9BACL|nr:hypothetical protein [Paenibacillus sp. JX-17]MDO7905101.1 hypothetical protein [Paenibacillus sp. JX-17]
MNQELSRMQKYGSQRRSGRKKSAEVTQESTKERSKVREKTSLDASAASLSRRAAQARRAKAASTEDARRTPEEEEELLTRAEMFPSRRLRLSRWFLNTLSFLFVLLTIGLFWWGFQGAPPLSTFWDWF